MSLSNEAGRARGEGPRAAGSIRAAVIASVIDLLPLSPTPARAAHPAVRSQIRPLYASVAHFIIIIISLLQKI